MKYDMKQKQPYWHRGTAEEWKALTPEARAVIWSQKPAPTPETSPVKSLEERIADLERRVGILERDDQG
jgi:hypothetical protein